MLDEMHRQLIAVVETTRSYEVTMRDVFG